MLESLQHAVAAPLDMSNASMTFWCSSRLKLWWVVQALPRASMCMILFIIVWSRAQIRCACLCFDATASSVIYMLSMCTVYPGKLESCPTEFPVPAGSA